MDAYHHTFETWNKLAEAYHKKFNELDLYTDTYHSFCDSITVDGAKIFEIGCGPGTITKHLHSLRPDFNIDAIDVAPKMIELAKQFNPEINFEVMDCRRIEAIAKTYNGIVCGFCMPYLSKEECIKMIKDAAKLLVSNGIFYFSTIEDDYSKSGYESSSDGQHSMYVYYHEASYLIKALDENGFKLFKEYRKNYEKADGTVSTHLILLAQRK